MQVIAVVKSGSQVECLFDDVPKGRHLFAIQDVSGSTAFVNFAVSLEFDLTVVSRLHPDTLYSLSAASVTLFGSGFPSSILCNLGNFAIVEALVLNEFQVICYFEKLSNASGPFQIMITPKERNFNVSAGVVSVMPSPEIFAILPSIYGTRQNSCPVTIFGKHFTDASNLKCSLGSLLAEVEVINLNKVVCLTPCLKSGNFTIGLDLGSILIKGPSLSFADVVRISSVQPSVSSLSGHTVVNVLGENLEALVNPRCIFGDDIEVPAALKVYHPILSFNSSNLSSIASKDVQFVHSKSVSLQCIAPNWPQKEIVSLSLQGDQGFSLNALLFEFDSALSLTAVFPSVGVVGTSMVLTLSGRGFSSNTRAKLQDQFLLDFKNVSETVFVGKSPVLFPQEILSFQSHKMHRSFQQDRA